MALLKECYKGRADRVELWGAMFEGKDLRQVETEHGNMGRGGWKGILTRELERIILGQCERQKDIEWMRKEVSRIDPTYVDTWDKLKEGPEKQYSRTGIAPWKVGHQSRDPWTPFRKCEGMKIPLRKPRCGL
jgi:hypothetical protein